MGICGSLMDIFDSPQPRSANKNIYDCHSISIAMICCFVYKVIEANG